MNQVSSCCYFPDVQLEKQRVNDFYKFKKTGKEMQKSSTSSDLVITPPPDSSPDFYKLKGIQHKATVYYALMSNYNIVNVRILAFLWGLRPVSQLVRAKQHFNQQDLTVLAYFSFFLFFWFVGLPWVTAGLFRSLWIVSLIFFSNLFLSVTTTRSYHILSFYQRF